MQKSNKNDTESQDQGFYIPRMKVDEPQKLSEQLSSILTITLTDDNDNQNDNQNISQANDLVLCERPMDFMARVIAREMDYRQYPKELRVKRDVQYNYDQTRQEDIEEMIPISRERPRQKRYSSLKAKYQNNPQYQCVYSKVNNNLEFDGYIFSLQKTTDYNPQDYLLPRKSDKSTLHSTNSTDILFQPMFDSCFETGNLLYAFQHMRCIEKEGFLHEYDLIMQNDTNTKGYNQWFHFCFRNEKKRKVRFNVVNFIKKKLMFLDGVRPVGFSMKENRNRISHQSTRNSKLYSYSWHPISTNLAYCKSYITRQISGPINSPPTYKNYYTLSFQVQFPFEQDQFYIAMNYPYSYSEMMSFVNNLVEKSPESLQVTKGIICHTISNNALPWVKVKSRENEIEIPKDKINHKEKGKIVCLARQHPGESVGSFVLEAFVTEIIESWRSEHETEYIQRKKEAQRLRQMMQNEQERHQNGVQFGENETNPIEMQSNTGSPRKKKASNYNSRRKKNHNQLLSPSKPKNNLLLDNFELIIIPMVNPDGVIYGNFRTNLSGFDLNRQWSEPNRWLQPQIFFLKRFLKSLTNIQFCLDFHGHSKKLNSFIYSCTDECVNDFRIYPWIFGQQCQLFSVKDCTYSITMDKIRTARINIYKDVKKPYVYTLETSFFGYTQAGKNYRWKLNNFQKIGRDGAIALNILMTDSKKVKNYEQEIKAKSYLFDQWAYFNKEDMGSESNPSEDQLDKVERQNKVMSESASNKIVVSKKSKKKKNKAKKGDSPRKKFSERGLPGLQKIGTKKTIQGNRQRSFPQLEFERRIEMPSKVAKQKEGTSAAISFSQTKIGKPQFVQKVRPGPIIPPKQGPRQLYNKYSKTVPSKNSLGDNPLSASKNHSNLLDNSGYLRLRQQKQRHSRSFRETNIQGCLQIISTSQKPSKLLQQYRDYHINLMRPVQFKYSRKNFVSQSYGNLGDKDHPHKNGLQYAQSAQSRTTKLKEKIYIIKEHKVVNSFTRINDQEVKTRLQKEIQNRTSQLRKCQNVLSSIAEGGSAIQREKKQKNTESATIKGTEAGQEDRDAIEGFRNKAFLKPLDGRRGEEGSEHRDKRVPTKQTF